MSSLEITMSIKCGECITISNYSLKRDNMDNALQLSDTINEHHMGRFEAKQTYPDAIHITCTQCGHEDELYI
ncbi:hypothetical protein ACT7DP_30610 [Bacillus paranthracis]